MMIPQGADVLSESSWGCSRAEFLLWWHGPTHACQPRSTHTMRPGAGHDLNDHDGLPDGSGVAVSHSLRLGGYLLNHGRRWHAFLINVQVRNAKTASGTTVAIADKAKVYILTRLHHLDTLLTLTVRCPSSCPRKNTALCLGLLKWYLFLTKLGGKHNKRHFGLEPIIVLTTMFLFYFLQRCHIW